MEGRDGMSGKEKFALLVLILLTATVALYYYNLIYLPEQRRAPYRQYGNTMQIDEFLSEYPNSNGNRTRSGNNS